MTVHRALYAFVFVVGCAGPVAAQAQIGLNAAAPGTAITVAAGSTVSLSITGGPGNTTDWIGLYAAGTSDYSYLNWCYLSGTQSLPATGLTSATFGFPLPSTPGDYDFRFFANNSWQRLAVSAVATGAPPPTVTSVSPSTGGVGDVVTITGTQFRATQASSTLTFNGTAAPPVNWSDGSIMARVPLGATTGSVVVTVFGLASNSTSFTVTTVLPGTISGTITRATGGSAIAGATVQAILAGVTKASVSTAANGTYATASLDPGIYDLRVTASGFSNELRSITVTANAVSTANLAMLQPGSISGKVTLTSGGTALAGAAVNLYLGASQKATTSTNATGDYAVTNLHPAVYTAQAVSVGYRTKEQAATLVENTNTTANISVDAAAAGPVTYAYDDLGRLVQVTNPSGDSAIYRYDAVGNLTAVERPSAGTVAISEFTPNGGIIGTTVTLFGTGFSTTPAQDAVTFNGVAAAVSAATATQIVTTVPTSATSGAIAVTTPTGSATSGTPFTVGTSNGIPTITSFTPLTIGSGTALTVNGTNFDTIAANDGLRLNVAFSQVTSATTTSLQTSVPPSATTGHVSVATPGGTAVSSSYLWVAPVPYVATDLYSTTTLGFNTATSLSVPTANKVALLAFDGTEGHRAALGIASVTGGSVIVSLYDPLAKVIQSALSVGTDGFLDTTNLLSSATYSLVFAPQTTASTGATLTLYDVPADFAAAISAGGAAVTVTTTVPGQNGRLTFTGTAGQRVSLDQSGYNCFLSATTLLNPDNSVQASTCGGAFIDVQTLGATGTYAIVVDPKAATTGSTTLTLYNVPADTTGSISPGGAAVTVTTTVPGQNGTLTFTATAGQRVALNQSGYNCFTATTTLKKPDGSTQASTCGGTYIDTQTLSAAGTYTILVDPKDQTTGSTTLTLLAVPADASGSATIGGSGVSLSMGSIGQNGAVTFTGTQGQQATVHITNNTVNGVVYVTLLSTDGVTVLTSTAAFMSGVDLTTQTLPATGTYTVVVDPSGMSTGSVTVSITSP
jgi:YD repeat-containing protein